MKRLFKYIALALAIPMLAVGCTADYIEPDVNKLPSAETFDVTIDVNQETNYVTFTMNNKLMVPMFIFGDQLVMVRQVRPTPIRAMVSLCVSAMQVHTR